MSKKNFSLGILGLLALNATAFAADKPVEMVVESNSCFATVLSVSECSSLQSIKIGRPKVNSWKDEGVDPTGMSEGDSHHYSLSYEVGLGTKRTRADGKVEYVVINTKKRHLVKVGISSCEKERESLLRFVKTAFPCNRPNPWTDTSEN